MNRNTVLKIYIVFYFIVGTIAVFSTVSQFMNGDILNTVSSLVMAYACGFAIAYLAGEVES